MEPSASSEKHNAGQIGSDDGPIWDDGVLDDHNDAVLDDKALLLTIGFPHAFLVDDLAVGANAGVLVDDGLAHCRVWACTAKGNVIWAAASSTQLPKLATNPAYVCRGLLPGTLPLSHAWISALPSQHGQMHRCKPSKYD